MLLTLLSSEKCRVRHKISIRFDCCGWFLNKFFKYISAILFDTIYQLAMVGNLVGQKEH